ncbi:MAG: hypothetical protein BI182_12280 [Acetobacterium sp. MES1]|uniref:hypothetical protein n=1 Tax=Acetobacterium sp. MES1 TaxID=1899015 RepID=UPI000B9C800E|nr:hypothetical protein [Acetobacterium sp. MES1]OXS26901.1 MAG: hypothetical protein BI182_12280 [Acetobacterium sp. MES1]
MLEYVHYTVPNSEELREQINKVKGDRSMATFADDIKRSSPSVKVSAPTLSRACNWTGGNPVSIELLEAIAKIADKDSGVTFETLVAANGMRSKNEDSQLSKRDLAFRRREFTLEYERNAGMIIQSEITSRGYILRTLSRIYSGYSLHGYKNQQDRVFPRNYSFGFSVSGMSPYSIWKFGLCSSRLNDEANESVIEAHVGNYINKIASVFASDSFESDLYESEKYSFVFVDEKVYETFLNRINAHGLLVNGLITAVLVDLDEFCVMEETQLKRYDGAEASSFFKVTIQQDRDDMELFEPIDFDDEEDL